MPAENADGGKGGEVRAFPVYDKLDRNVIVSNLRGNLPLKLRNLRSYLVWKYLPATKHKKRGKLPYYVRSLSPRHGTQGNPEDLKELATFGEAVNLCLKTKAYNGIGIAAVAGNTVSFIDVDGCIGEDGALNALATELLQWGTYTEYSPGGRGLRLIVDGNLHLDGKNHADGLEIFSDKGFVTLTGSPFGTARPLQTLNTAQQERLRQLVSVHQPHADDDGLTRAIPTPLTPTRLRDVRKALTHVDPDCGYADWIAVGQALHSGDPDPHGNGFSTWLKWSRRGSKFEGTSANEMLDKWTGFKAGGGVTLATIFHMAKSSGYVHGSIASEDHKEIGGVLLEQATASGKLDPVCEGLFDHTGAYMFVGRAKIGKSRILGLMAAAALTGGSVFGHKFLAPCKTLILALEERSDDVFERLRMYLVEPEDHVGQWAVLDHKRFQHEADRWSEEYNYVQWLDVILGKVKPRLVLLDPLVNLRMVWQHAPESPTKRVTEEDYHMASQLERLAQKHHCALVFTMHGSKRRHVQQGAFDPFETVGTTSWTAAGCTGTFVIMDLPNFNPLEQEDNGQRIFSVRTRFKRGDEHLLLQNGRHGTISSLGPYHVVVRTRAQEEMLHALAELQRGTGAAWVTATQIARHVGCSVRNVRDTLARALRDGAIEFQAQVLESSAQGYRLASPVQGQQPRARSFTRQPR